MGYGFKVIAEGPYACFTRPDIKTQRISYDVPTPGALEGMLKSVYWKPAIRYVIDQIVVFNDIAFQNMAQSAAPPAADSAERSGAANRLPQLAMALGNVRYGIAFHFEMTGVQDDEPNPSKQYNMIMRRLRKGLCFRQPCFGLSACPVTHLRLVDDFDLDEISPVIRAQGDVDLGSMLYGLTYREDAPPVRRDANRLVFAEQATAVYYHPRMIDGIIDVQRYRNPEPGQMKAEDAV